jgi:amino-acid N-acetyltransferase
MIRYRIRPAVADDSSTIKALVRAARINPTGLKWPRFLVAELNPGEVIACAQIKPHRDGSHELASLVVDPAFRGQGIARSLVEHLLEAHEGELYLMCRSSLGNFYKKLGFEVIAEPQMTPYFRKINRLASLSKLLRKENETLLVMRCI